MANNLEIIRMQVYNFGKFLFCGILSFWHRYIQWFCLLNWSHEVVFHDLWIGFSRIEVVLHDVHIARSMFAPLVWPGVSACQFRPVSVHFLLFFCCECGQVEFIIVVAKWVVFIVLHACKKSPILSTGPKPMNSQQI